MSSNDYLSDEILNAYLDHELDDHEMIRIQALLAQDANLLRRLNVLQRLKMLVRAAKPEYSQTASCQRTDHQKSYRCQFMMAAVVLAFSGWLMWVMFPVNEHVPLNIATTQGIEQTTTNRLLDDAVNHAVVKVVLHVKRNEKMAGQNLFDQIDTLLAAAERRHATVRIEVLANGEGLSLLRQDMSPYAQKIQTFSNRYDNVVFIACGDTIKRLNLTLADLKLFPEVMVVTSVKQQIRLRRTQGWTVIQV